jgi:hypothetical protein
MACAFIGSTEDIIAVLFPQDHCAHVHDRRWHLKMMNLNPNYQAELAERQAAKRAAGIGPEGICRA